MPTTRPRHVITETEQVARALEDAARRWPEEGSRARLLLRLLEEGHRAVLGQHGDRAASRRDTVARTRGALTGAYGPGYLVELREDWPA